MDLVNYKGSPFSYSISNETTGESKFINIAPALQSGCESLF